MSNVRASGGLSGLPLQRKIPLIVLALFAFVLGTGIVVSYYEVRHAAELAAADRLKSLSGAIASVAAQPVTLRVQNLRRVAGDPAIVDALRHPDRPYGPEIRRAMSPVLNTPADTGVTGLWTRAGRPLGTGQGDGRHEQECESCEMCAHPGDDTPKPE